MKQNICPKLCIVPSREDLLERYCDKYEARIIRCYEEDWNRYVEICRAFLKGRFTNDLKVLMIDDIEPIPKNLNTRFTAYEKSEYCQYLFRNAVCLDPKDQVIGKEIEYELPVSFKIYIKKNRWDRLANQGMPKTFCVKDFNSIRDLCVKSIQPKLSQYGFDCRPIDEGVQNNFKFFTLNLIQKRKYNKSEDLLIKGKRDREMNIITNYKPNKMFFQKQSLFASESDQSQESIFATVGLVILGSLIVGTALGIDFKKNKYENQLYFLKESTKFFTPEEVDIIDAYINKLSLDIKKIEEEYIKYLNLGKFENDIEAKVNDNIRKESIASTRISLYKNKINEKCNLMIPLEFIVNILDDSHDDGTFVTGSTDNISGIINRAKEFSDKKLGSISLTSSKSKIVSIYDDEETIRSDQYLFSRIVEIEFPKNIKDMILEIKKRYDDSNEIQSNESLKNLLVVKRLSEIKQDKSFPKVKEKAIKWMKKNDLKPLTMDKLVEFVKKQNKVKNALTSFKDFKIETIDGISFVYMSQYSTQRATLLGIFGILTSAVYNKVNGNIVSNVWAAGLDKTGKVKFMMPPVYSIKCSKEEFKETKSAKEIIKEKK